MPEHPLPKIRPAPVVKKPSQGDTQRNVPDYAELHCKTNYSFLRGASHPDELVQTALQSGHRALAITDRNSLAGVVRAYAAAKGTDLKLLIGAEVTPVDAPPVVLLATNRTAYGHLSSLLTVGKRRADKGECHLAFRDLADRSSDLLACVATLNSKPLQDYRAAFSDRCYLLAEQHYDADDRSRMTQLLKLSTRSRVPLVAANDVHYHEPKRRFLHDTLTAIRYGCTVEQLGQRMFANGERYLKSPQQINHLFADVPAAIQNTMEVADRCQFDLSELRYEYPIELSPAGVTPFAYLKELTWQGAADRYPDGIPPKVHDLVCYELSLIEELQYEAYFLTVWDLVRFARVRDILCQGRGSAANSAVCYCLGITSVDPSRIDVLFERFISRERNEAPDIDIDFEHERREEVLQYLYDKYGRDRAGMTATVITYRPKSAIRDVGKALGLSTDRIDQLSSSLEHYNDESNFDDRLQERGLDPTSYTGRCLIRLVKQLLGFPRHLSQHVGGMVLTNGLLSELVPIENARMPDRTCIEWDKDDLDALGLLKVDCLSLGMLTAIRKCFDLIHRHYDRRLTLATVPANDRATYDMICEADTVGVFQIESRAQMSMLPRLKPRCFYDLVIEVAIVRPGPIQGGMVHPYLRRRSGEEDVTYPDSRVREVLEKTLGVVIFQEQAMRLAVVAGGFTPGEADQLRRAMGAWRRKGTLDTFRVKLLNGMTANGYDEDFANRLYQQIQGFGEYGFPESHACSFALITYCSCWLKKHYPAAFTASLLNSQPMGFYQPAQLVRDCREHGVDVRSIDINNSDWDCTLESNGDRKALRLGFRLIRGFQRQHAELLTNARRNGPFTSLDNLAVRTGLGRSVLQQLSSADVFQSVELNRREALWQALSSSKPMPLTKHQDDEPIPSLPVMTTEQEVHHDYRAYGLSLKRHPLSFIRSELNSVRVISSRQLREHGHGNFVRVAGLVLIRQRPATAGGITFVTLEDEHGSINLIIKQNVWNKFHAIARHASVLLAAGRVQRDGQVIHILVQRLEDLSELLQNVESRSRDFQ